MGNDDRNERGRLTAEKTLKMLKDEGVEVTLEQAEMILAFYENWEVLQFLIF